MNRRQAIATTVGTGLSILGIQETAKSETNNFIYGKSREWIPYKGEKTDNLLQCDIIGNHKIYYIDIENTTPEDADKFLKKIKEKLNKKP